MREDCDIYEYLHEKKNGLQFINYEEIKVEVVEADKKKEAEAQEAMVEEEPNWKKFTIPENPRLQIYYRKLIANNHIKWLKDKTLIQQETKTEEFLDSSSSISEGSTITPHDFRTPHSSHSEKEVYQELSKEELEASQSFKQFMNRVQN